MPKKHLMKEKKTVHHIWNQCISKDIKLHFLNKNDSMKLPKEVLFPVFTLCILLMSGRP